jgi:hypothetical protein
MNAKLAKKVKGTSENGDVSTYRRIRRSIGYLGVGLPIALILFSLIPFFKTSIQPSISHFYYTNLREIFTGTLCAVGLFLVRYKGFGNKKWWRNDNLLTNIAGVMAFGVAFIPTDPIFPMTRNTTLIPYDWNFLGGLHFTFAGTLFLSFSILSIFVFTLGQKNESGIPKSLFDENNIYRFCGYSILLFIALVPLCNALKLFDHSTLVLEALSLFAFGIAWLIKGRALGQTGKTGEKLYRERN